MRKALVLSLAVILGLGFAAFAQGELSGEWDTEINIDPDANQLGGFFGFTSELTVTYSIGGWDLTSYSVFDETGWLVQTFDAAGAFGAFTIGSSLVLGTDGTFTSWGVDTSFTFGAVAIGIDFDLIGEDIRLCLTGDATTGLVDITVDLCFGDYLWDAAGDPDPTTGNGICDLDWAGIDITIAFPFCCADVTATLAIDCYGFQEACFSVDGIVVANIPWFTLDAEVCFELQTKTLTLTPAFDFGADVCFDVYICAPADAGVGPSGPVLAIPEIYITGIGLVCEIGGVSFTGISFWGDVCDDYKPDILGDYWEMYQIATTEDACCGPFDFSVAVYFDAASTSLFDVAAFDANFSYELGEALTFTMGLYNQFSPTTDLELSIGFEVTW